MMEECAEFFWKNAREFVGKMHGSFLEKCTGVFWKNAREFFGKMHGSFLVKTKYPGNSILYACLLHNFKLSNDRFSDFAK